MYLEPLPDHPTWALPDSTDTAALLEVISELLIDLGLGSGLTEASVKWRRLFEKAALGLMKRNRDFKFVKLDPTNQLIELRVDLATTESLAPTRLVCALVSADGPIVPLLFFYQTIRWLTRLRQGHPKRNIRTGNQHEGKSSCSIFKKKIK
jgi:hypothetical protein